MITLDYLPKTDIKLYQDDEMIRINTDTEVLGEFLEVYRNDTVLDMGTNQGALLLYASRFNPKKLIGLQMMTSTGSAAYVIISPFIIS